MAQQAPTPGDVIDGYQFKGGDPASPSSWAPAPAVPAKGSVVDGYQFLGGDPSKQENWAPTKGEGLVKAAQSGWEAAKNTAASALLTVAKPFLSDYDSELATAAGQRLQDERKAAYQPVGTAEKVVHGVVNAAPAVAAALANPALGLVMFTGQAGFDAYQGAKDQGLSDTNAIAKGTLAAGINLAAGPVLGKASPLLQKAPIVGPLFDKVAADTVPGAVKNVAQGSVVMGALHPANTAANAAVDLATGENKGATYDFVPDAATLITGAVLPVPHASRDYLARNRMPASPSVLPDGTVGVTHADGSLFSAGGADGFIRANQLEGAQAVPVQVQGKTVGFAVQRPEDIVTQQRLATRKMLDAVTTTDGTADLGSAVAQAQQATDAAAQAAVTKSLLAIRGLREGMPPDVAPAAPVEAKAPEAPVTANAPITLTLPDGTAHDTFAVSRADLPAAAPGKTTGVTREMFDLFDALQQVNGTKMVVVNSLPGADGMVSGKDGTIHISKNAVIDPAEVAGHESWHAIKNALNEGLADGQSHPAVQAVEQAVAAGLDGHAKARIVLDQNGGAVPDGMSSLTPGEKLDPRALTDNQITALAGHFDANQGHYLTEVSADLHGAAMKSPTFWSNVVDNLSAHYGASEATTMFGKIVDAVRGAMQSYQQVFAGKRPSYATRQFMSNLGEVASALEQAQAAFMRQRSGSARDTKAPESVPAKNTENGLLPKQLAAVQAAGLDTRIDGLMGRVRAFTEPSLPADKAAPVADRGADNSSLESQIPERGAKSEAGTPKPKVPRPSKLGGVPTEKLTDEQLSATASNDQLPAITRRGATVELQAREEERQADMSKPEPESVQPEEVAVQKPAVASAPGMSAEDAAKYLKDFAYSLGQLDGMTDRAQVELSGPLGKSGRDNLLMRAFGLTRERAHDINNHLDARQPKTLRNVDLQEAFDVFPGLRELVNDAIEKAASRAAKAHAITRRGATVELQAREEERQVPVAEKPAGRQPTELQRRAAFGKAIGAVVDSGGHYLNGRINRAMGAAVQRGDWAAFTQALAASKNPVVARIGELASRLQGHSVGIDSDAVESRQVSALAGDAAHMQATTLELLDKLRALAPRVEAATSPREVSALLSDVRNEAFERFVAANGDSMPANRSFAASVEAAVPGVPFGAISSKQQFARVLSEVEKQVAAFGEDKLRRSASQAGIATRDMGAVAGAYNAEAKRVTAAYDRAASDEKVMGHEAAHAVLSEIISNPTPEQAPLVERLRELQEHVRGVMQSEADAKNEGAAVLSQIPYGATSVQEFVAEGIGNPDFQYRLSRIAYQGKTAWGKFTEFVANLLGLKNDNAFTEFLAIKEQLTGPMGEKQAPATDVYATKAEAKEAQRQQPDMRVVATVELQAREEERKDLAPAVVDWKDRENAPIGSWVKADFKLADSQPVYQVRELDPEKLYLPELGSDGRLSPDKRKYLDPYTARAVSGEKPPAISVIEMEDGRLRVTDGHRRALAAKAAGKTIRALVSPLVDTPSGRAEATVENIRGLQQTSAAKDNAPAADVYATKAEAKEAQRQQPDMRVVATEGGYTLAPKTEAQIAAQAAAARRIAGNVGAEGGPLNVNQFIASRGGLAESEKSDLGVEGNVRVGSMWLFRKTGMTLDGAVEILQEAGYLKNDDHNEARDLIQRTLRGDPQYTPEGWDRIAEAEAQSRYEEHLEAQREEAAKATDEWTPEAIMAEDMQAVPELGRASEDLKAEVAALLDLAESHGIDREALLERAAQATENGTENDYYEQAKALAQQAIEESGRGGSLDGTGREDEGRPRQEAQSASAADGSEGAGRPGYALDQPTREEVVARQEQAAGADKADERDQIRRESEAGAGSFELAREDGRQDNTGSLFSRTRAEQAVNDAASYSRRRESLDEPTRTFGDRLESIKSSIGKFFSSGAGREVALFANPMGATDNTTAVAAAFKFANDLRRSTWQWTTIQDKLAKDFTPEQLKRMYLAADEENEIRSGRMQASDKVGIDSLPKAQREVVELMHSYATELLQRARDVGLFQGEGLPYWTPRMAVMIGEDGNFKPFEFDGGTGAAGSSLTNLRTSSPNLKQRKYATMEEYQAAIDKAAEAAGNKGAAAVQDIRTVPFALNRLERAVAGRELINQVKLEGQLTGRELVREGEGGDSNFFTIVDHPAFRTYRTSQAADGKPVRDSVPIYIDKTWEGPLRAVLDNKLPFDKLYKGMMQAKAESMNLIMASPLTHNMVIFGRAAAHGIPVVSAIQSYFIGYKAADNAALMREMIDHGMVPIGHKGFLQDALGVQQGDSIKPGNSLVSKAVGLAFGEAGKKAVDAAGDFWHNKLLWDRVGDLQRGIYVQTKAAAIKDGMPEGAASYIAAHTANRFAGAIPNESVSKGARALMNASLFSRTFQQANLGMVKDMVAGLPAGARAAVTQAYGDVMAKTASKKVQRAMWTAFVADFALAWVVNNLTQASASGLLKDDEEGTALDKLSRAYGQRWAEAQMRIQQNWTNAFNPFFIPTTMSLTGANEEKAVHKVRIGTEDDGTATYLRIPSGKIPEELEAWLTHAPHTLETKLSPVLKGIWQSAVNDQGYNRPVYLDDDNLLKKVGKSVVHVMEAQIPVDAIKAHADLLMGNESRRDSNLPAFMSTAERQKVAGFWTGFSTSSGAPGGPVIGEMYAAENAHRQRMAAVNPKVQDLVRHGKTDEAFDVLTEAGATPGEANHKINSILVPGMRAKGLGKTLKTADELERFRIYNAE